MEKYVCDHRRTHTETHIKVKEPNMTVSTPESYVVVRGFQEDIQKVMGVFDQRDQAILFVKGYISGDADTDWEEIKAYSKWHHPYSGFIEVLSVYRYS